MDRRFLILALATEAIGIALFSVAYVYALTATSLNSMALNANIAILVLAVGAGLATILGAIAIVRRSGITRKTAVISGLTSFVLGIYALFASFLSSFGYQDAQMACGGLPPSSWTIDNLPSRCGIWATTHADWVATIFLLILMTSAAMFWASVITILRAENVKSQQVSWRISHAICACGGSVGISRRLFRYRHG